MNHRPLIAHVLYSLDTGGMERFVITLINNMGERYRHAIVCLTESGPTLRELADASVPCLALHKQPGKDWRCYARFWRTLRLLRPDVVHTYNIGTLDLAPIAKLAGVRSVVHAERGRDVTDPNGEDRRYRRLRRWMSPFISRYLAVSRDLESWLVGSVGIAPSKVVYMPNGIDVRKFYARSPSVNARPLLGEFAPDGALVIINVGRLDAVKDHTSLIDAFNVLCQRNPQASARLRLAIVGEGGQRAPLEQQIARYGLANQVRLFGNRDDVPALLAEADIFVLSSVAEGMPGVVLEAMASGLPVVATRVGGTVELVVDGETGMLVAPSDPSALASALARYIDDLDLRLLHGREGRQLVERRFSLTSMLAAYRELYDLLLIPRARQGRSNAKVGIAGPGEP